MFPVSGQRDTLPALAIALKGCQQVGGSPQGREEEGQYLKPTTCEAFFPDKDKVEGGHISRKHWSSASNLIRFNMGPCFLPYFLWLQSFGSNVLFSRFDLQNETKQNINTHTNVRRSTRYDNTNHILKTNKGSWHVGGWGVGNLYTFPKRQSASSIHSLVTLRLSTQLSSIYSEGPRWSFPCWMFAPPERGLMCLHLKTTAITLETFSLLFTFNLHNINHI